jgi:hypothetical protein
MAVEAGAKGNVRGLENTRKSRAEKKINLYNLVVSAHLKHSFTFPLSGKSVRRRGSRPIPLVSHPKLKKVETRESS